jgi:hypothetical protein
MITERDFKILKFINRFNYATRSTIQDLYFTKNSKEGGLQMANRRLLRLKRADLLNRERDFRTGEYIYFLSKKGVHYAREKGLDASEYSSIRWGTYVHNDTIQKVFLEFVKAGHTKFITEKEFRIMNGIKSNIPDLILSHNKSRFSFLEIELEEKKLERLKVKLKAFSEIKNLKKVLYICLLPRVVKKIIRTANELEITELVLATTIEDFFENPEVYTFDLLK